MARIIVGLYKKKEAEEDHLTLVGTETYTDGQLCILLKDKNTKESIHVCFSREELEEDDSLLCRGIKSFVEKKVEKKKDNEVTDEDLLATISP